MTGPNEVTEYKFRVGGDRLDAWRFGECSLKCQNGTTERKLQNTVDHYEKIQDKSTKHTNVFALWFRSSGIIHQRGGETDTWRADHKCDSDTRAAWTITRCTVKVEEQTSLFKLIEQEVELVLQY